MNKAETPAEQGAHDKAIAEIITAIRQLTSPAGQNKKHPIGFAPWKEE